MQPPKRQIIKTRPQRPYVVARVLFALIVLAALALAAVLLFSRAHASHTAVPQAKMALRQEAQFAERKMLIQASIASRRSSKVDRSNGALRS